MSIMMNRIKWIVGASALTIASGAGAAGTGVQAEPDWTLPIHDNQVFGQVLTRFLARFWTRKYSVEFY